MALSPRIAATARGIRATLGLRQQDVADRAGIHRSTVSLIESGHRTITVEDLWALCAGLDVTLPDLLAGLEPEQRRRLGA